MASIFPISTGSRLVGACGAIGMLAGIALLVWGPERREDLLARTVAMAALSDSVDGGRSDSRLVPDPKGARCSWKLRPGFRYPWAGIRFHLVASDSLTFDLSWSRSIHLRMEAAPASNLRLQILSRDGSHRPGRTTAHAREFNVGSALDTVIAWPEFRIPAWYRDSLEPTGDQRLELLAQATAIDIQSAYVGPGHDSTNLRVLTLEARGPSPIWSLVGRILTIGGCLSLVALAVILIRIAYVRNKQQRLESLIDGRKSVQLDSNHLRLRQEVQAALKERFADPNLSLESLSAHLKMPSRTVANLLKEATDLNFKPALNELRLAEAARLLRETDGAVAEIGYAVGFQNSTHFGRAFRERYGSSPSKWRETESAKHGNDPIKHGSTGSAESI